MPYLSEKALDNLKYYKYSSEDKSKLVKWFLGAFWNWIVSWFPTWLAPNLITMMGFTCLVLNFATVIAFTPNLEDPAPRWAYMSFCIGIFLYQIMDNIDGRQARRTGSSSPLGELVDHGCDSLFVPVTSITMCCAFRTSEWGTLLWLNMCILPFYFAHWEEWYTGKLILSTYGNPTEAQLAMCFGQTLTFILGTDWWNTSVSSVLHWWSFGLLNVPYMDWLNANDFVLLCIGLGSMFSAYLNSKAVFNVLNRDKLSTTKALSMLIPYFSVVTGPALWYYISPAHILQHHVVACVMFQGLVFAYAMDTMMINRVTKIDFNIWNPLFMLPWIGFANALVNPNQQHDVFLLYTLLIFIASCYAHMVHGVVNELCTHLKIRCFSITPKKVD